MAGACLTGIKSINVEANKKNKTILFTTTLPREPPVSLLNHKLRRMSPGIAFQMCSESTN
jgi:hypothetical protein